MLFLFNATIGTVVTAWLVREALEERNRMSYFILGFAASGTIGSWVLWLMAWLMA